MKDKNLHFHACKLTNYVNGRKTVKNCFIGGHYRQGRSKGGGQVRILLAHPRIKVKHIKNKIHLQYLSIICLWFKISASLLRP
jgi:hypothetical protein